MALTKGTTVIQDWLQVAAQGIVEGGPVSIADGYDNFLFAQAALDSTTAHTGTKFRVQVSNQTSGDEDWHDLFEIILCVGTAATEALAGAETGGAATVLEVADTTGFVTNGIWLFLKDDTIAASELVFQLSYVTNTSITVLDAITNSHTAADALWNVAESKSWQLPSAAQRVRLIVDNNYDSGASTICYRAWVVKVTAL